MPRNIGRSCGVSTLVGTFATSTPTEGFGIWEIYVNLKVNL